MRKTMITLRATLLTLIACAGLHAQCLAGGMVVIVNKANATESLSMAQLRKLILGDVRTWPDKQPVMLISRELSSDVFKCVLSSIVRMNDAEYHRYLLSTEFRGGDPPSVKTVNSGATAAKIIAALGGSIAVVPASELPAMAGTVRVVKVNGKEQGEAGYPL
jgi:hypothetical protein